MASDPWTLPIGIPVPGFGIVETYRMYDDPACRNPALTYQASAEGGFFTHYVDNTHPAATDTANPFGSIAKPRKTIPRPLPAGSVVEVHGGAYAADPKVNGIGTLEQPIFVRGMGEPRFTAPFTIGFYGYQDAAYLICEGLSLYRMAICAYASTHHVVLRHSKVEGALADVHGALVGTTIPSAAQPTATIHDIVVWDNEICNGGNWQAAGDPDMHGMAVTHNVSHVWILDNVFHHNSGNGVQINAGSIPLQNTVHDIYLGRNRAYQNKQDGFWTKNATDVIFSQNTVWDHTPSDSSLGGGMGSQYGPERVWFLFNEIWNCAYGIRQSTDTGGGGTGPGTDNYFIGNLIHNIHRQAGETGGLNSWKKGSAFLFASETSAKGVYDNIIANCDAGILVPRRATIQAHGNTFSGVAEEHVFLEFPDSRAGSDLGGNAFDQPARIVWGRTGDQKTYDLDGFNAAYPGKADGSVEVDTPTVSPWDDTPYALFEKLYGLDIRPETPETPEPSVPSVSLDEIRELIREELKAARLAEIDLRIAQLQQEKETL